MAKWMPKGLQKRLKIDPEREKTPFETDVENDIEFGRHFSRFGVDFGVQFGAKIHDKSIPRPIFSAS